MTLHLSPHQIKAISEIRPGSVLKGGTGSGKTRTALAYFLFRVCQGKVPYNNAGSFEPAKTPKPLYVITTARKRDSKDWVKEAVDFRIFEEPDPSGMSITVDSWNNILNYTDVKNAFFIFDEQRLVGRGAWVKAFYKIAAKNQWILLSATPGDNWMDYGPVFVANKFYRNISDFKTQHIVWAPYTTFPKVERWEKPEKLQKLRDLIVVEMPMVRHTKRHIRQKIVEFNRDNFNTVLKKRWNIYEEKPIESLAEYYYILRKVCNSDRSRTDAIREILDDHPRLIVFYNFDYELDILREFAEEIDLDYAEWNGHKHQPVPTTKYWIYFVQYMAGAEAWNCTETDAMAFFSLNYSYKINEQAQGRIDRMNTPFTDLWYYYIRSTSMIDLEILKALQRKKTFNEKGSRIAREAFKDEKTVS